MIELDPSQPATGVEPDLERLLALRFPARQLDIRRRRRTLTHLAGAQRSNFRGRGLEFEEVRGYQPGDDIRAIDWRVTARTGAAHTKLFHEERERPVLLVTDQRGPMHFGSRHCFKNVLAAELTALIAWSALNSNERVGALIADDREHRELRPRSNRRAVLSLLSALCDGPGDDGSAQPAMPLPMADILHTARRIARTGSSIFIISDFHDAADESAQESLFQLARHTEITAISCSDPLEVSLPPAGIYAVTDGRARCELDTSERMLRERHTQAVHAQRDALESMLKRLGIPLIDAHTDQAPLHTLKQYFGSGR